MIEQNRQAIEALFAEHRSFPPPADFVRQANLRDPDIYKRAADNPERYWEEEAEQLDWFERWRKVLHWDEKTKVARWFDGGKLNASYNCLDRHVAAGHGKQVAFFWEGEPGDTQTVTYADLMAETCRLANALKELGVRRGDRVAIYMGMVAQLPAALLACARIGAIHSVVFGGFSAESLRDRMIDGECKVLITQDQGWRRGGKIMLKNIADEALKRRRLRRKSHRVAAHRRSGGLATAARRVVSRYRRPPERRMRSRAHGRRRRPLHPVLERHHGQAQGHRAHDRRLSHRRRFDAPHHLRHQKR